MTIYNLYIFDGTGTCLIYRSWNQHTLSTKAIQQRCKLTFGLIYSMKVHLPLSSLATSNHR